MFSCLNSEIFCSQNGADTRNWQLLVFGSTLSQCPCVEFHVVDKIAMWLWISMVGFCMQQVILKWIIIMNPSYMQFSLLNEKGQAATVQTRNHWISDSKAAGCLSSFLEKSHRKGGHPECRRMDLRKVDSLNYLIKFILGSVRESSIFLPGTLNASSVLKNAMERDISGKGAQRSVSLNSRTTPEPFSLRVASSEKEKMSCTIKFCTLTVDEKCRCCSKTAAVLVFSKIRGKLSEEVFHIPHVRFVCDFAHHT